MDNTYKKSGAIGIKQRITGLFPWLVSIKRRLRTMLSYWRMALDGNTYARTQRGETLPQHIFSGSEALYNTRTGFPMEYQHNKVYNLKLVARVLDGVVIRPGETFSFWMLARHADRTQKYRDGLVSINGKLAAAPGGGLCQMSNTLFWAFLHSPLTVVERHGHILKEFPEPNSDAIKGVDAAIAEGMKDLKVRNDTTYSYQLRISFSDESITVALHTDDPYPAIYDVSNGNTVYCMDDGELCEYTTVCRGATAFDGTQLQQELVYVNRCRIGYPLPEGTEILEEGESWAINLQ